MLCQYPIPITIPNKILINAKLQREEWDKDTMYVPCRECPICIKKRTNEWTMRLQHELELQQWTGCFATLTYEDLLCPTQGVIKEDITKFLKRLRKKSQTSGIKYFICGEYGTKTYRPHYHAILIGIRPDKELIQKTWGLGLTDVRKIEYGSIKYVVDYIKKEIAPEAVGERNWPFTMKSKGLGREWMKKYISEILEDKTIIQNGYRRSIPRYYLKKFKDWGGEWEQYRQYLLEAEDERVRALNAREQKRVSDENLENQIWGDTSQIAENIKAKKRLK